MRYSLCAIRYMTFEGSSKRTRVRRAILASLRLSIELTSPHYIAKHPRAAPCYRVRHVLGGHTLMPLATHNRKRTENLERSELDALALTRTGILNFLLPTWATPSRSFAAAPPAIPLRCHQWQDATDQSNRCHIDPNSQARAGVAQEKPPSISAVPSQRSNSLYLDHRRYAA